MTESEAKHSKWCPFVQVSLYDTVILNNRNQTNADEQHPKSSACCIAPECMAWRQIVIDQDYKFGPTDADGKMEVLQSPLTDRGYCGLAGKP